MRRLTLAAVTLAGLAALTGCSGAGDPSPTATDTKSSAASANAADARAALTAATTASLAKVKTAGIVESCLVDEKQTVTMVFDAPGTETYKGAYLDSKTGAAELLLETDGFTPYLAESALNEPAASITAGPQADMVTVIDTRQTVSVYTIGNDGTLNAVTGTDNDGKKWSCTIAYQVDKDARQILADAAKKADTAVVPAETK